MYFFWVVWQKHYTMSTNHVEQFAIRQIQDNDEWVVVRIMIDCLFVNSKLKTQNVFI